MAAPWTFCCYVSARGIDEIREAFNGQPRQVQAKFVSRLRVLSGLNRGEWTRPLVGVLYGQCEGLWEIRF